MMPHVGEPTGTSGDVAVPAVAANDGRVPILGRYPNSETATDPVLKAWSDSKLAAGGPYRPRFMVYSGLGSPAMTAERLGILQEIGAESFLLAADLPAQLGFDPDHELAHAQVGRAGVSCATLDDFATICSKLDLSAADSVSMLQNSLGHVGLGMVHSVLQDRELIRSRSLCRTIRSRSSPLGEPRSTPRSRPCASRPTQWRSPSTSASPELR
jgi:hypothetical protein